jgi:hypothetical protein
VDYRLLNAVTIKNKYPLPRIVSINVSEEKTNILTGALGCQVQGMPFTCLGLPLGTTKPVIQDFMPMLTRIEKRLMVLHLSPPMQEG